MGKKFEGAHPTSETIIAGYQLLGLSKLLGNPGKHTFAEFRTSALTEEVEVFCLPGILAGDEVLGLFKDAGLLAR